MGTKVVENSRDQEPQEETEQDHRPGTKKDGGDFVPAAKQTGK
jgi:hypothetical protein